GRPDLHECFVEGAGRGQVHRVVVGGAGSPVDEVVAGGPVDAALAEVHPPLPVDLLGDDHAGFGPVVAARIHDLEGVEVIEQRAVLGPGAQVRRGGQAQLCHRPVPAGVGEVEGALDVRDARVLAAVPLVAVFGGEDRGVLALEGVPVIAEGYADV